MEIKDSEWLSMRDDYNGLKRRLVEVIAERDKLRELLSASNGLLHVFCWAAPLVLKPRVEEVKDQIAANEAVLGDNNGTDQK